MKSMTGFGAASATISGGALRIEISGVNRKQLEVAHNLPRNWAVFDAPLRAQIAQGVSRGRVNVSITSEQTEGAAQALTLHSSKLESLKTQLEQVESNLGKEVTLNLDSLLRLGIIEDKGEGETDLEALAPSFTAVLTEALAAFNQMRADEGQAMKDDLLARIAKLRTMREEMMHLSAAVAPRYRETLMARLAESGLDLPLEDERLIKEIALFADRCDTSEETTRLACHFDQFEIIAAKDEPVGRTLDFLCQEIFRELNTTGSKANDATLAQLVVSAKTELEKIREQVQNIE